MGVETGKLYYDKLIMFVFVSKFLYLVLKKMCNYIQTRLRNFNRKLSLFHLDFRFGKPAYIL